MIPSMTTEPAGAAAPATADARHTLLARLIDHAPLFPPASLALPEALAAHRRARASAEAWMLGRFVSPASRLVELGAEALALTVVLDGAWGDTSAFAGDTRVEAVEARLAGDPAALAGAAAEVYVELPLDGELERRIETLAGLGLRAKARCGGERVPTVEELARFVGLCRGAGVPFKATAGLHHALRTQEQHGFLNLLAAAVFGDERDALTEDEAAVFTVDRDRFAWRGREADAGEVGRVRRELFVGFGSCDFSEPVEELRALAVLPA